MMNNAIQKFSRSALASQRRFMSSNEQYSTTFLKPAKEYYSFRKAWLSDPATYPLILVLGGAAGLCSGFMAYFTLTSGDVQINPAKRNSIMRTWGN